MSGVGVTSLDTDELRDELAAWQVAVAEAELADGRHHLLGGSFTVADLLLATCLDWAAFYGEKLSAPLESYRGRMASRDAYRRAWEVNFPAAVLEQLRAQRAQ